MNKVIRTTWIILLLTVASGMARAQQGLQIASVFQKYGKQKGVTMVELSNEMLETYQMTLYKSLVFKDVEEALPTILNCLDADKKKAKESEGSGGRRTNPVRLLSIAPAKRRCQPVHPVQNR